MYTYSVCGKKLAQTQSYDRHAQSLEIYTIFGCTTLLRGP